MSKSTKTARILYLTQELCEAVADAEGREHLYTTANEIALTFQDERDLVKVFVIAAIEEMLRRVAGEIP